MRPTSRAKRFLIEAEAHFDSLYRYALFLTREAADAEDLLQRTLLQAYQCFHRYTPGSNCRAWLVKIMKNLHLMSLRTQECTGWASVHEQSFVPSRQSHVEELYAAPQTPEELLVRKKTVEEVWSVIDRLPGLFREVIVLVDVEGLTYDQAAGALGCATGTVKSRLYRARNMFKAELLRAGGSAEAKDNVRSGGDAV